jgi:hypothetical protein
MHIQEAVLHIQTSYVILSAGNSPYAPLKEARANRARHTNIWDFILLLDGCKVFVVDSRVSAGRARTNCLLSLAWVTSEDSL